MDTNQTEQQAEAATDQAAEVIKETGSAEPAKPETVPEQGQE